MPDIADIHPEAGIQDKDLPSADGALEVSLNFIPQQNLHDFTLQESAGVAGWEHVCLLVEYLVGLKCLALSTSQTAISCSLYDACC